MCHVYFCPHPPSRLSAETEQRVLMAVDPAVSGITGMRRAGDAHCGSLMGTRTRDSEIGAPRETESRPDSIIPL